MMKKQIIVIGFMWVTLSISSFSATLVSMDQTQFKAAYRE